MESGRRKACERLALVYFAQRRHQGSTLGHELSHYAMRPRELLAEDSEDLEEQPAKWPRLSVLLPVVVLVALAAAGSRVGVTGDVEGLIEEESYGGRFDGKD